MNETAQNIIEKRKKDEKKTRRDGIEEKSVLLST